MSFNEECWIIYGVRVKKTLLGYMSYESEGSPASVDFNWEKVFQFKDKIIGFNHTHPSGMETPSSIDDTTMIGWVKALGKPLICGIHSGEQNVFLYERCNDSTVRWRPVPFYKMGNIIKVTILP